MWSRDEIERPHRFEWRQKIVRLMQAHRKSTEPVPGMSMEYPEMVGMRPERSWYADDFQGFRSYKKDTAKWDRINADLSDEVGAVWYLRDRAQDKRQEERDAYQRKYRPVLSVTDEERMRIQNKWCAKFWGGCVGETNFDPPSRVRRTIPILFPVLVALLLSCPYYLAVKISHAAESYDITNDRRVKVGDVYDPGHGRPLQIRDSRRRIIGYIDKDGSITDTRRRKVKELEVRDD